MGRTKSALEIRFGLEDILSPTYDSSSLGKRMREVALMEVDDYKLEHFAAAVAAVSSIPPLAAPLPPPLSAAAMPAHSQDRRVGQQTPSRTDRQRRQLASSMRAAAGRHHSSPRRASVGLVTARHESLSQSCQLSHTYTATARA